MIVLASLSARADNAERIFSGQRQLVATEGRAYNCTLTPENQTLKLRLAGNVVSNMQGTCRATVNPDGAFGAQCNVGGIVIYPRGRVTGSTITLHTRNVGNETVCEYDTILQETK
jgi:hypothetical protein